MDATQWNGPDERIDDRAEEPIEERKRELLMLRLSQLAPPDLAEIVRDLWEACYTEFMEPPNQLQAALRAWDIDWWSLGK